MSNFALHHESNVKQNSAASLVKILDFVLKRIFINEMKMKTGVELRMFELVRLSAVMEINQLVEDRSITTKTEYSSKSITG